MKDGLPSCQKRLEPQNVDDDIEGCKRLFHVGDLGDVAAASSFLV